jgi:arsenate reductase (thioredoxin)
VKRPKRVLFVCIGNSCRSQMAEAFARVHGKDVVEPASAGVYPAIKIAPDTHEAMAEKNIDLKGQFPKSVEQMDLSKFDLIVDMSGGLLDGIQKPPVETWDVPDPIMLEYEEHCAVRDRIELLVKDLIRELKSQWRSVHVLGFGR